MRKIISTREAYLGKFIHINSWLLMVSSQILMMFLTGTDDMPNVYWWRFLGILIIFLMDTEDPLTHCRTVCLMNTEDCLYRVSLDTKRGRKIWVFQSLGIWNWKRFWLQTSQMKLHRVRTLKLFWMTKLSDTWSRNSNDLKIKWWFLKRTLIVLRGFNILRVHKRQTKVKTWFYVSEGKSTFNYL